MAVKVTVPLLSQGGGEGEQCGRRSAGGAGAEGRDGSRRGALHLPRHQPARGSLRGVRLGHHR